MAGVAYTKDTSTVWLSGYQCVGFCCGWVLLDYMHQLSVCRVMAGTRFPMLQVLIWVRQWVRCFLRLGFSDIYRPVASAGRVLAYTSAEGPDRCWGLQCFWVFAAPWFGALLPPNPSVHLVLTEASCPIRRVLNIPGANCGRFRQGCRLWLMLYPP